jgi:hypothetical protein
MNRRILKQYHHQSIGFFRLLAYCCIILTCCFSTCKYSFKDTAPIPPEVKTFRVNFLENKARYINPQLSPKLTEKLKQKIIGNTRLRQTNADDTHYDINGYVSDYSISTTGINGNSASTNRLSVTFHLIFKNNLNDKQNIESDVNYAFDYSSSLTQSAVEAQEIDKIVSNLVDGIFNKIFSNW